MLSIINGIFARKESFIYKLKKLTVSIYIKSCHVKTLAQYQKIKQIMYHITRRFYVRISLFILLLQPKYHHQRKIQQK